jgi:hypothetical protein
MTAKEVAAAFRILGRRAKYSDSPRLTLKLNPLCSGVCTRARSSLPLIGNLCDFEVECAAGDGGRQATHMHPSRTVWLLIGAQAVAASFAILALGAVGKRV